VGRIRRNLLDHIAGIDDFKVAMGAYQAALTRWPHARVIAARCAHCAGQWAAIGHCLTSPILGTLLFN
jgi:hypothetical protein